MNTLEALKALYVAMGGQLTDTFEAIADGAAVKDYVLIPDLILAIAQKAPAVGIELPKVSSSDNGKVLTVVSGKWNKANLPS